jgi:hypothetical protein
MVAVKREERTCLIIDVAIQETSITDKYQELKREIKNYWSMKNIEVIPVVVRALGAVSKKFENKSTNWYICKTRASTKKRRSEQLKT